MSILTPEWQKYMLLFPSFLLMTGLLTGTHSLAKLSTSVLCLFSFFSFLNLGCCCLFSPPLALLQHCLASILSFTFLSRNVLSMSWLRGNQWIMPSISSSISLVYLSISWISRLGKFSSTKFINEKFTEEQNISDCTCYHAPADHVSLLNHDLKSNELFLDLVRGSRYLRQMSV